MTHDENHWTWRSLLSTVDGDVVGTLVTGEAAMPIWHRLRDDAERSGRWPLLLGPPIVAAEVLDRATSWRREPPRSVLANALTIDIAAFLDRFEPELGSASNQEDVVGEWPDEPPGEVADLAQDLLTGTIDPEVQLALLPTPSSWETPAWLSWGGWNACPAPAVHVAALRHWHDTYGAELVAVTSDQLELRVLRPPATRSDALTVAHEHFAYCIDIVIESAGTISEYAAMLLEGPTWTFWWD